MNECVEALDDDSPTSIDYNTYRLNMLYYEKIGDYKKAFENQTKFHILKDELNDERVSTKILELQSKYEIEKQIQKNRLLQSKNFQLQEANNTITSKNTELQERNDYIQLTSKILRHDVTNNLSVMNSAMRLFKKTNKTTYLEEIPKQIKKSVDLLRTLRNLSNLLKKDEALIPLNLRADIFDKLIPNYPSLKIEINGNSKVLATQILESVFDNLFVNVVNHSRAERVEIDITSDLGCVQIRFADFGIGIPDKIKEKIFLESYSYGANANTGLGLYIAKKAIENIGGSIEVENNYPSGTIFILKLRNADQ